MTVQENLEAFIERIKRSKEALVKEYPEDADSPITIEIHRHDTAAGTIVAEPNLDLFELLLKFSIVGMGADEIWLGLETYHSEHMICPGTGKPWVEDEMADAMTNHPDWWVDGMITEAIAVLVWNRSGDLVEDMLPYKIENGLIVWGERPGKGMVFSNLNEVVGTMWLDTTMAEDALSAKEGGRPDLPQMPDELKKQLETMSIEERETRIDVIVATFIRAVASHMRVMAVVSLDAPDGSERQRILTERAPGVGAIHLKPGETLGDHW